ncbi:MAG: Asp/Glu racemase [Hyphomicrobiales bacterium]|nr:MAG: Asp/Glu racemase [Hyphomicrobiales bacterium]
MKLLFINPNTSAHLTEMGAKIARSVARPDTEIVPATGRFGARYITSRASAAVAGHAVLDTFAREGAGADAVVIACFGDPGLFALRELAGVPVIGMAEASCHMAATLGRKFAIVTGGRAWGPMLEEFVAAIGLSTSLAGVRTVAPSGADIAADPEKALASLRDVCLTAVKEDGADAVILGGLGLAGLAERIAADVPVPLIDNVVAAIRMAEAAATLGVSKAKSGSFSTGEPVKTLGLSAPLAALLEGRQKT